MTRFDGCVLIPIQASHYYSVKSGAYFKTTKSKLQGTKYREFGFPIPNMSREISSPHPYLKSTNETSQFSMERFHPNKVGT